MVSVIRAYNWGSITNLRQEMRQGFRSLKGCWQILTWWAYKYIPAIQPHYLGLSMTIYPRAYAWPLCDISRVVLTQRTTISAALDCVTWVEIRNIPYDEGLLAKTLAMGQSCARH